MVKGCVVGDIERGAMNFGGGYGDFRRGLKLFVFVFCVKYKEDLG